MKGIVRMISELKNKFFLSTDRLLLILGLIVLIVESLYYVQFLNIIYVVPDEFGYWSAAAWFAGYDWGELTKLNSYYSFGYGLILSIIIRCFKGVTLYKASILINGFFVSCMFVLLKKIADIFSDKKCVNVLISLSICLYSPLATYAKTSQCEIFLYFCYVLLLYFLLRILIKPTLWTITGYLFTALFLFCIHMRSIGIMLLSLLMICFLLYRKHIKIKFVLPICVFFVFLLVGTFFIKDQIINNLYLSSTTVSVNTFAGQTWKLSKLFSVQGVIELTKGIIAKLWYLGTATYLVLFVGIYALGKSVIKNLKGIWNANYINLYELYILLALFSAVLIASIYTLSSTRIDTLIYGRYIEYSILPVLLYGLQKLLSKNINVKEISYIIIVYIVCSLITYNEYATDKYRGIVFTSVTGIFKALWAIRQMIWHQWDLNTLLTTMLHCSLWSLLIFLLVCFTCFIRKGMNNWRIFLIIILFTFQWYANGIAFVTDEIIPYQEKNHVIDIAECIEENDKEGNIPIYYIYNAEDTERRRVYVLQMLLKNRIIHGIDLDEVDMIPESEYYIVVCDSSMYKKSVDDKYQKIVSGYPLTLYLCN